MRGCSTSPPTGATTLPGLAYAGRLGLWAAGETPFETREAFISAMEAGGVAAMEVVAPGPEGAGALPGPRALVCGRRGGGRRARADRGATEDLRRLRGAFQVIHAHLDAALQATGVTDGRETLNRNARSAALSAFEAPSSASSAPAHRHEVPHPPPGGGGGPGRGPRLRRPARLDRRGRCSNAGWPSFPWTSGTT